MKTMKHGSLRKKSPIHDLIEFRSQMGGWRKSQFGRSRLPAEVVPGVFEHAIRDNTTKLSHYPLTQSALTVLSLGHAFAQSTMQPG
jgi:hypothetical protein